MGAKQHRLEAAAGSAARFSAARRSVTPRIDALCLLLCATAVPLVSAGVRRISWTGYAMSLRLLRYSTGLRAPRQILIRVSLYQRMCASRAWVNCAMLAAV